MHKIANGVDHVNGEMGRWKLSWTSQQRHRRVVCSKYTGSLPVVTQWRRIDWSRMELIYALHSMLKLAFFSSLRTTLEDKSVVQAISQTIITRHVYDRAWLSSPDDSVRKIWSQKKPCYAFAYCVVHSRAVCMAAFWSSFHLCATSLAKGSSGLGAPSRAWIERSIVRIWRAGDQLPVKLWSAK